MAVPVLEFFMPDWQVVPAAAGSIQFRLIAIPPVAANVGIVVFAKPTTPLPGQPTQWAKIGNAFIDNIPNTVPGSVFQMSVARGVDYVLRFQGEAHLLMPGFQDVTVGFDLSSPLAPLTNFGGSHTANQTRAAGINGNAFLRCA